ncbi:DUF438 domain-containing protein [Gracilinema caldarium]|uniref:Uncharacterized protein n=1 Tax=Gracilinema caldarium (strain ATCC 51460 / DSM 7334 / H1) TaxID=744872 RepID=F8F2N0_GRAC1|nr:DUF438 domain-containing protein [Gracilinema caldarium]AEJ19145.1 protein of unknown function DUF438 [Gracilinema caldarium DSM 7334]
MSELIQNDAYKKEELKKIIKRLHDGEPVSRVKKDFDTLIKNVSAEEIAAMEQALMQAGMPAEEIQRLCEVHVTVFENTLESQGKPEKLAGHPIHTYMAENDAGRASLKRLKAAYRRLFFPWGRSKAAIDALTRGVEDFKKIVIHYTRKENQLFPYLEQAGFDAPSKVMWGKHDEIRALFRDIDGAIQNQDYGTAVRKARLLAGKAQKMFFMEEHILFPTALRKLDEKTWVTIRRGEDAIGYAWVRPGSLWDPDIIEARLMNQQSAAAAPAGGTENAAPARAVEAMVASPTGRTAETAVPAPDQVPGVVKLGEGWMTNEQIDLMLKNLPIDISFVDEHDRVLYYSDNPERIFPRSPGVIGRNVANCHPPKSVHIVQRIVQAFRNKEKKVAEFWLELGGKFVHIRYFPVYDDQGNYRGTLEVSQDVTAIRALQGQRRLLDWD